MLFSELFWKKMENEHFDTGNMSSAAAAAAIAAIAAHIIAIGLVAIACPPSLPSPSLLHATTPIANAMALAAPALFVAHHPHSPSPFPPSPSLLLPLTSAARSGHSSLLAVVVLWSSMLSLQPPPTLNAPVAS
jgi:hypothetical protein